ncbi:PTS sugar transporter subunit IIA [Vagococcus luciliae]|uniref:PTS sugar transporter subunit IIA n=1 Tax=Vagococcus luciliae TaxID=2920380 RepID=UPI00214E4C8F|nr:PTS sugar transporter subunit IIA [Vagococcus luciliae]
MNFYLSEELILKNETYDVQKDLFENIGNYLSLKGYVKDSFINEIQKREENFPTGLELDGYGVAIPHTDPEHIKREFLCLVTLEKPIVFQSMADKNKDVLINTVFVLGFKKAEHQLLMLRTLMNLIQDKTFIENLNSKEKHEIIKLIENTEENVK